eukprot:GHVL01025555.1.p1 GENE.GHVL01025555.1~~GHVL01025555.1.p1  ORF type:complete len:512 (+),score=69.33 GHVL01025555.1:101-1537(+)
MKTSQLDLFPLTRGVKSGEFQNLLREAHALEFLLITHKLKLPSSYNKGELLEEDNLLKLRDAKNLMSAHLAALRELHRIENFTEYFQSYTSALLNKVVSHLATFPDWFSTSEFTSAFEELLNIFDQSGKEENKELNKALYKAGLELARLDSAIKVFGPQIEYDLHLLTRNLSFIKHLNLFLENLASAFDAMILAHDKDSLKDALSKREEIKITQAQIDLMFEATKDRQDRETLIQLLDTTLEGMSSEAEKLEMTEGMPSEEEKLKMTLKHIATQLKFFKSLERVMILRPVSLSQSPLSTKKVLQVSKIPSTKNRASTGSISTSVTKQQHSTKKNRASTGSISTSSSMKNTSSGSFRSEMVKHLSPVGKNTPRHKSIHQPSTKDNSVLTGTISPSMGMENLRYHNPFNIEEDITETVNILKQLQSDTPVLIDRAKLNYGVVCRTYIDEELTTPMIWALKYILCVGPDKILEIDLKNFES